MSEQVTGECLRRFERIEKDNKEREKRIRDLEKFQVVTVSVVGVANFIWVFFVYPFFVKAHGG